MQLLKCVVVFAVITATGISKAHSFYVPPSYTLAPLPDTAINERDKGKAAAATKKKWQGRQQTSDFYAMQVTTTCTS